MKAIRKEEEVQHVINDQEKYIILGLCQAHPWHVPCSRVSKAPLRPQITEDVEVRHVY